MSRTPSSLRPWLWRIMAWHAASRCWRHSSTFTASACLLRPAHDISPGMTGDWLKTCQVPRSAHVFVEGLHESALGVMGASTRPTKVILELRGKNLPPAREQLPGRARKIIRLHTPPRWLDKKFFYASTASGRRQETRLLEVELHALRLVRHGTF